MNESLLSSITTRGVRIVAHIHHSHGVKAAAAIRHLSVAFPHWDDDFWLSALAHSGWFEEPAVDGAMASPVLPMNASKAKTVLERAVMPLAYNATAQWARSVGIAGVIDHYIDQACNAPEYLGHRLSILLAYLEAWPMYRDGPDTNLFFDRLAEFIVTCRFSAAEISAASTRATFNEALSAAIRRPGFFGHCLIALAWTHRSEVALTEQQKASAYAWVVASSNAHYEDEDDNLSISAMSQHVDAAQLEDALRKLLGHGRRNIHLFTLADALEYLWNLASDAERAYLLAVAAHNTESDAAA